MSREYNPDDLDAQAVRYLRSRRAALVGDVRAVINLQRRLRKAGFQDMSDILPVVPKARSSNPDTTRLALAEVAVRALIMLRLDSAHPDRFDSMKRDEAYGALRDALGRAFDLTEFYDEIAKNERFGNSPVDPVITSLEFED